MCLWLVVCCCMDFFEFCIKVVTSLKVGYLLYLFYLLYNT